MKILLTGKTGQVGHALQSSLEGLGQVIATDRTQLDLSDLEGLRRTLRTLAPALIVNAAAYTAVEQAEREPELAFRVNAEAVRVMAEEAGALGAALLHYSTDYVFDGRKAGAYLESDTPQPLNVYGRSKLAGEQALRAAGIPYLLLRTSWVYGLHGRNFLRTILDKAARGETLQVVDDQFGAPTWSHTIAAASAHALAGATQAAQAGQWLAWWRQHGGLYHMSAQGSTSWYGFARAILDHPHVASHIRQSKRSPQLTAIASAAYPSAVVRPANSMLCCDKFQQVFYALPEWQADLNACLERTGQPA